MKLFKAQRASSVLALALDGEKLEAVVVRRAGSSLQARQMVSAGMALSALTGDPELVGREIRNHLDSAGVRERNCVVSLPLTWMLTLQCKLPEGVSEADVDSYLQIEAERGFTSGHESLHIVRSRFTSPSGEHFATLLAVPRNHLASLEKVLKAAKLKPLAFAMGMSGMQSPSKSPQRVLALSVSSHGLELQVSGGGGVVALRSLDAAVEMEGNRRKISTDLVARELRITLGQLPGGFSESGGVMKIFGTEEISKPFITEISPRLTAMGLRVEPVARPADVAFEGTPSPEWGASQVLALGAAYVQSVDFGPDFLPPKITQWQQFVNTKLSSQRMAYAGGAGAFVVLCLLGVFGWQEYQILQLDAQWKPMEAKYNELVKEQANIDKFQAWFDPSCRALSIWKNLTFAMPETGTVWVKSVDIRDLTDVQLQGTATSISEFYAMRDRLSKIEGVTDLTAETRGNPPQIQYTLNYKWQPDKGVASNGN